MITSNGKHSLFLRLFSGFCLFGSSSDHYYQSVLKVGSFCLEIHSFRNNSKNYFSRALKKLVNDQQDDWDQYLDASLFSLRSKIQTTTKFSPFLLMYGREARFPSEVPVELPVGFFFSLFLENGFLLGPSIK